MPEVLTGVYRDRDSALKAAERLLAAGFTREEVCLLAPDVPGTTHFAAVPRKGTMAGAGGGAIVGLALGAVAGAAQALTAITVPGLELAAGPPLVSALVGAGGGAGLGALLGALVGAFRLRLEAVVRGDGSGFALLGVSAPRTMVRSAVELLERTGAFKVTRGS